MSGRRMIAALLLATTATIAACGSDRVATVAITYSRSTTAETMPDAVENGVPLPLIRWGSGGQLVLITWGSGSCPLLPTEVTFQNAHRITITLASHTGPNATGCTADLTATNSIVAAPTGLDSSTPAIAVIQSHDVALSTRG